MANRSGRFKVKLASAAKVEIISGRTESFYRVFNSGDFAFEVNAGGGKMKVEPRHTLDIVLVAAVVEISNPAASEVLIEGIYDFLDPYSEVRSGRFTLPSAPASPHKIIDLNATGKPPYAYYRVFNSGDNEFEVWTSAAKISSVKPEQSYDFEIAQTGGKRDIYIKASTYPIDGIYDFLGSST